MVTNHQIIPALPGFGGRLCVFTHFLQRSCSLEARRCEAKLTPQVFHKQVSTFQVWLTAREATQANVHRCTRNAHRPPCGTQQHVHVERLDGCLDSVGFFFLFFSVRSKTIRIGRLLGCHICICPPGASSRAAADDGLCVRGPSGSHGFSLLSPPLSVSPPSFPSIPSH